MRSEQIPEILTRLGIKYTESKNRYFFSCPVHGGDNPTGCTVFGNEPINWKCWTHECHTKWKSSFVGFVRGALTTLRKEPVSFFDTLKWMNVKYGEVEVNEREESLKLYSNILSEFTREPVRKNKNIDRSYIRRNLIIPSPYYLEKGFNPEILNRFDIGDCMDKSMPMYNRALVPIYDENNIYVGCSGRAIEDNVLKWKNSFNLNKTQYLYGLNFAKKYIAESGTAIIAEGPANIWRLVEAEYKNSISLIGRSLSEAQLVLLERSGCLNLVILTDMDGPGREAVDKIIDLCGRRFNYIIPQYDKNDPASYKDVKELQKMLLSYNIKQTR